MRIFAGNFAVNEIGISNKKIKGQKRFRNANYSTVSKKRSS